MSFRCRKLKDLQDSFDIYSETFNTTTLEKFLIVAIIIIFLLMAIVPFAIWIFHINDKEVIYEGIYRHFIQKQ